MINCWLIPLDKLSGFVLLTVLFTCSSKKRQTNYPCTSRIEFSDTSGIYSVLLNVYVEDNKILIWFSLKLKMTYLDWWRAMHYIRFFFFFWGSTSVESFGEPEVSGELLY
jgi:hypothetical protein